MENHKTPWTIKEEKDLCHQIRLGQPIADIALIHKRTEKAIEMRLASIFQNRIEKGDKLSLICNEFSMTEKQIQKFINDLQENKKRYSLEKTVTLQDLFTKLELIEKRLEKI